MTILVLVAAFLIYKIISSAVSAKKEKDQRMQIERIKAEQARQKAEYQRQQMEYKKQQVAAKEWQRRQIAMEKEQIRQAKEQERLAKEQAKQAEQLAKHEAQIAKLEYTVSKAVKDIEDLTDELGKKYALLDIAQNQQMIAVPGSKADESAQKKILSYEKSIRTLENKINKARFDKEQAERQLSA